MASVSAADLGRRALALGLSVLACAACGAGGGSPDTADSSDGVELPAPDSRADSSPGDATDPDAFDGAELPAPPGPLVCVPETLGAERLDMPEASGAAWVDNALGTGWLVVADSGNDGAGALLDAVNFQTLPVDFPLDPGAGDDVEGLALAPSGRVVGLASPGYIREWSAEPSGLVLTRLAAAVSSDPDDLCDPQGGNCAANFEGLCLHPAPPAGAACAGFAVSKARGQLACLALTGDGYRIDAAHTIAVGDPDQLSGCDYELEPPHRLVVAGNLFALSAIWEVRGADAPETAEVVALPLTGAANQEALAFGPGGLLISFGDTQGFGGSLTSPMVGFRCQ